MNWPAAAACVSGFLGQKSEWLCRDGKSTRMQRLAFRSGAGGQYGCRPHASKLRAGSELKVSQGKIFFRSIWTDREFFRHGQLRFQCQCGQSRIALFASTRYGGLNGCRCCRLTVQAQSFTIILPKLSPLNSARNASRALSRPT